mgnify:CR=1 FL=1
MSTTYKVSGMTCGGCVRSVTRALEQALPGTKVLVSLEAKTAEVDGQHDPAKAKAAIEGAGFEVEPGA